MKKLIITILLAVIGFTANAQRVIEKNINNKDQVVNIEVPFASQIEVKTWDKTNIYVKADLTTEDGKYLDLYELQINEGNGKIDIISKAEAIFKKHQEDNKKEYSKRTTIKEGDNLKYDNVIYTDGIDYTFNYVIYVPKGAEVKLSSINGHLNSEVLEGNFAIDLINGNINIKEYYGDLDLSTINGEIDISLKDSNVEAETIHGDIYADEGLKFTSDSRVVGQHIERKNVSGKNNLQLSTINGNMYLRN